MNRLDDNSLALHLEVALAGAAPSLLSSLTDPDRRRRHVAVSDMARHLADRLRCFDIRCEQSSGSSQPQPSLFPQALAPGE